MNLFNFIKKKKNKIIENSDCATVGAGRKRPTLVSSTQNSDPLQRATQNMVFALLKTKVQAHDVWYHCSCKISLLYHPDFNFFSDFFVTAFKTEILRSYF